MQEWKQEYQVRSFQQPRRNIMMSLSKVRAMEMQSSRQIQSIVGVESIVFVNKWLLWVK